MDAFRRSFANGYGIETDIRDLSGKIVISHDVPLGCHVSLQELLNEATHKSLYQPVTLALNIKSDGLLSLLEMEVRRHASLSVDCFVFDMSVPDMRSYLNSNFSVFTRLSDAEPVPAWFNLAAGVWLDAFECEWYSLDDVRNLLASGKRVCIVSPELHGRSHHALWARLKPIWNNPALMLCTDYPDEALAYFTSTT